MCRLLFLWGIAPCLTGRCKGDSLWTKGNEDIATLLSIRLQLPQAVADDTLVFKYNIAQSTDDVNLTGEGNISISDDAIPGQSTRNNPNQIDGTLKTEYNGVNGGVLNESAGAAGVRGVAGDTLPLSERDGITDAIGGQATGGNQVLRGFLTPDENLNQAVARTGATPLELTDTTGDPQLFSSALEQARQANPHGLMVSGKVWRN